MSLIKNVTLGIVCLVGIVSKVVGQAPPMPTICSTPPAGYALGGNMSLQSVTCVPVTSTSAPVTVINARNANTNLWLDNPVFYFDVDNTFNINTATNGVPAISNTVNTQLPAGFHWILLKGEKNGNKYLTCSLQETLQTLKPVVTASACTGNEVTINIPKDPNNTHERYSINWGGTAGIEIINISTKPLPVVTKKTFPSLPNQVSVQGIYIRNNIQVCQTAYFGTDINSDRTSLIHTLSGENGGTEAKLDFLPVIPTQVFDVMVAVDNGTNVGTFTKLAEGINGKATVTGLNPDNKYCFKLRTKNSCNLDIFSDNTLCSVNLKATVKSSSSAELKWNLATLPSVIPTRVSIAKDEEGCTSCSNNIPFASSITTTYLATSLDCSKKYLYKVGYRYPSVTFEGTAWPINIYSPQIKVDLKSALVSAKPDYLVSVGYDPNDDTKIRVNIVTDAAAGVQNKYIFYRAENDSQNFTKLGERTTNVFDDVAVTSEIKSYCYKYQIEDKCGVTTQMSDPFCTIMLNSKSQGMLNWTPFLIPPDVYTNAQPVEYTVEYYDVDINSFVPLVKTSTLERSVQQILESSGNSEIKFRILGQQEIETVLFPNQTIPSYSNPFILKVPPGLFIPTAFTPDGQGPSESEAFKINGKFISSGSFKIFDRWGGTIFEADNLAESWNGTESNGVKPAPPGTYAYVINAVSDTGEAFKKTGTVILLR
jgi:gliding motility-associated-like protein